MPAAIPARPDAEQRLREACAQLRQRVREGDERALEEILAQFPELAGDPDQALELVYAEVALREQLGRQLPPAAWLDRFPQWRERLHKLLEVHQALRADGAGRTVDTSLSAAGQTPHTAASGTELAGPPKPRGYEVLEELGRGGMGVVFKARQVGLNRLVALKMILAGEFASDAERSRFRAEAEATARLDHPHIVRVHEVGDQDGQLFLAMEYVAGGTLAEVFASGPQSADEAARLVELLARAVEHAHQQGIIHRDLKPGNILLQGKASPKIVDFGLAKRFSNATTAGHGAATATGALLGTPSYMAPEQAAGGAVPIGPAVDVYALGAILYEALTGRPPFRGQTALDTLDQVRSHEPVPVRRLQPRVPRDLETICLKCLQKEPRRRYASANALADDLARFLRGETIQARSVGRVERGLKWVRRRPGLAVLLAAFALVVVIAFATVTVLWRQTARALIAERDSRATAEANLAARNIALARVEWSSNRLTEAREYLAQCPPIHRDQSWLDLNRACSAQLGALNLKLGIGRCLAFSPNSRQLAVAHEEGITLWDLVAGREVRSIAIPRARYPRLAYARGGECLVLARPKLLSEASKVPKKARGLTEFFAVGGGDVQALFSAWNVSDGTLIGEWHERCYFPHLSFSGCSTDLVLLKTNSAMFLRDVITGKLKHEPPLTSVNPEFSSDGELLLTCDKEYHWQVLNLKSQDTVTSTVELQSPQVALSTDLRLAVAVQRATEVYSDVPRRISVIDLRSGKTLTSFEAHRDFISMLKFSPNNRLLASASVDRTVVVWDPRSGVEKLTLRGHTDKVTYFEFSPDGRFLASAALDGTVRIWDIGGLTE